jgi:hypothetical protein
MRPKPPAESRRARRAAAWLLAAALLVLVSGALIYFFGRPAGTAFMLPAAITFFKAGPSALGDVLNGSWPAFAHAFVFSVLSCLVLPRRRLWAAWACSGWFVIECLFEIGQHPALSPWLAASLRGTFDGVPVLDHLPAYFARGVFDVYDIAFAGGGSLFAWLLVSRVLLPPAPRAQPAGR